jgi:hypothetical protein
VVFQWLIWNRLAMFSIASFKKCLPLSLMRILGQPNLVMTFSYKNVAVALASSTLTALAFAHFVRYYVVTMMYFIPLDELG